MPKKGYPTSPPPNHAGGFSGGKDSPCSGRTYRSQAEEPRVQGDGKMAFQARARATLKAKEHDVFAELAVA